MGAVVAAFQSTMVDRPRRLLRAHESTSSHGPEPSHRRAARHRCGCVRRLSAGGLRRRRGWRSSAAHHLPRQPGDPGQRPVRAAARAGVRTAAGGRGRALHRARQAHAQVRAGAERSCHLLQPPGSELRRLGAAPVEQRLRGWQLGCRAGDAARAGRRRGLRLRGHRHQLAGRPAAQLRALSGWRRGPDLRHLLGAAAARERGVRQLHHPRPHRPAADGGSAHQLHRGRGQPLPQHVLGGGGFHPGGERAARGPRGRGADLHQRRVRGVRGAAAGGGGSSRALDRFRHHPVGSCAGQRAAVRLGERGAGGGGRDARGRHGAGRRGGW